MSHARPPKDVPLAEAGEQGLSAAELEVLELRNRDRDRLDEIVDLRNDMRLVSMERDGARTEASAAKRERDAFRTRVRELETELAMARERAAAWDGHVCGGDW